MLGPRPGGPAGATAATASDDPTVRPAGESWFRAISRVDGNASILVRYCGSDNGILSPTGNREMPPNRLKREIIGGYLTCFGQLVFYRASDLADRRPVSMRKLATYSHPSTF